MGFRQAERIMQAGMQAIPKWPAQYNFSANNCYSPVPTPRTPLHASSLLLTSDNNPPYIDVGPRHQWHSNPGSTFCKARLTCSFCARCKPGALHGWAISERIQQISRDTLQVNQGSLYPALHRLEHQGWIKAEWGVSELGRRARFYKLTASGRKQLELETENWARLAAAIGRVLEMA